MTRAEFVGIEHTPIRGQTVLGRYPLKRKHGCFVIQIKTKGAYFASIIGYFDLIKGITAPKLSIQTLIMPIVIAILLVIKAPAALGIYFVSSALFTSIEQLIPLKENLNQAS